MCAAQDSSGEVPPAVRSESKNARSDLVEELLKESKEELARIDFKASILFGAFGVMMGVLLAGAVELRWDPTDLGAFQWLWWPGVALGVAALVALAAAVWPMFKRHQSKEELSYFGHVARYKTLDTLNAALDRQASDDPSRLDWATKRLLVVSSMVHTKYRCIRWGIVLSGLAALMCSLAVILASVL